MSTGIEWTDETWNPIRARLRSDPSRVGWHCEHASPGCINCYSETRNLSGRCNLGTKLPFKPGHRQDVEIFLDERALAKPLHWRKPRMIFVCSMTDLFADFVTDETIDRVFAVMALCPQHTFQLLTKRSARMREYLSRDRIIDRWCEAEMKVPGISTATESFLRACHIREEGFPLPNVWLGVSVEDQARADERIPDLLATPAAIRWLSCEPLLGPLDLKPGLWMRPPGKCGEYSHLSAIDWIVCGGESGKGARPMHPDWARTLRDQCAAAGVPFFFKQWGEWTPGENVERRAGWVSGAHWFDECWLFEDQNLADNDGHIDDEPALYRVGKKPAGRLLDGQLHDAMPETARA